MRERRHRWAQRLPGVWACTRCGENVVKLAIAGRAHGSMCPKLGA
jgi:hypothetical protein